LKTSLKNTTMAAAKRRPEEQTNSGRRAPDDCGHADKKNSPSGVG
jgi:hypothetical protein